MSEKKSIVVDPKKGNSNNKENTQLDALLKRMEQLETWRKEDKETIQKLMEVADKSRLSRLEKKDIEWEAISLCLYDDKIVIWLKIVTDIVEKNLETKKYDEEQIVELKFHNEERVRKLPFLEFMRRKQSTDKILAKEVSTSKKDGENVKTYTVEYKGEIIKLDSKFINI